MTFRRVGRLLLVALGLAMLLTAGGIALRLRDMAAELRPRLEKAASKHLRRELTIGALEWRAFPGPALIGRNVLLFEKDGSLLASSPEVVLEAAVGELLGGMVEIEQMTISRLQTHLLRRSDGLCPVAEMVGEIAQGDAPSGADSALFGVGFGIRRIELTTADIRAWKEDAPLARTRLLADGFVVLGGSMPFRLAGRLERAESGGDLELAGTFVPGLAVHARSEGMPLDALREIAPSIEGWTGMAAGEAGLRDDGAGLRWDAAGTVKGLRPPGEASLPELTGSYALSSRSTSTLVLAASHPAIRGSARMTWGDPARPGVRVDVDADHVDVGAIREMLLRPAGEAGVPSDASFRPPPWRLSARIGGLRWGEEVLRHAVFEGAGASDGSLKAGPISAEGFGGRLRAEISVQPSSGPAAGWSARHARLEWRARDMRLERVLRARGWPLRASGTVSGRGRWEGPLGGLPDLHGSGRAELILREIFSADISSTTPLLPEVRGKIAWEPREPWSIELNAGDDWSVRAHAHPPPLRRLSAEIEGKTLDFERLSGWTALVREAEAPDPGRPADDGWAIDAQVKFQQARFREVQLEELALVLEKRPEGPVRISGLRARGMGGVLEADLELSLPARGDPPGPAFYGIRWSTDGMDVERLLRSFGAKYMISGVGRTSGRLRGPLDRLKWGHATGTIDIEVGDGNVWQAPALVKALSTLSVTSALRRIGRKADVGFPFRTGRAQIELGGGKAVIRAPAHLENPSLKIAFIGTYDLAEETIDGRFVIYFLTVVDEVLRVVPGVRRLLFNKRMGLVPIWVEVKGPRQDPKVTILPARSISDALWQPVSSVFHLPLDLIKKAE
ncbi:MAG: AsmA-like C-terminal region-containing protein [Elusimicrobiota bacterium]